MNLLQITFLILISSIAALGQSNSWKSITPLHSTRADVEKLIRNSRENNSKSVTRYETNKEVVSFTYINHKCEAGWNVSQDTVFSIEISPVSMLNKSFEELKLDRNKFSYTVDDAFYGTWINAQDGLLYYFSNVDKELNYIKYIPKKSDSSLRCNGFPPYAPEGRHYPFEQLSFNNPAIGRKDNLYRQVASLDNLYVQFTQFEKGKYKAYALVYFDNKLPLKQYRAQLAELKNFVFQKRGYSKENLIFIEGGMQEEASVELYLLPIEWQPPSPNPTLPSSQFMKR